MLYVMLVGAYPFERPEDKHDNKKLQKMIQVSRICLAMLLYWLLHMLRALVTLRSASIRGPAPEVLCTNWDSCHAAVYSIWPNFCIDVF